MEPAAEPHARTRVKKGGSDERRFADGTMALEDVMDAIVHKARKERDGMVEDAQRRAKTMLEEAGAEGERRGKERFDSASRAMEKRLEGEMSSLRFAEYREGLLVRKEMLDELRSSFRAAVSGLDEAQHARLLASLLRAANEAVPEGKVSVRAQHRMMAMDIIRDIRGYTLGDDIECLGGAMIVAPDGNTIYDLRYDAIVDDVWRESLYDISSRLFGGGGESASHTEG